MNNAPGRQSGIKPQNGTMPNQATNAGMHVGFGAPPAYNPFAPANAPLVRHTIQQKPAGMTRPTAPPVYRPQAIQPKLVLGGTPRLPPPVYRPAAVQAKPSINGARMAAPVNRPPLYPAQSATLRTAIRKSAISPVSRTGIVQPYRATGRPSNPISRGKCIQRMQRLGGFAHGGAQAADFNRVDQNLARNVLAEMIYIDQNAELIYMTGVVGGDLGETFYEAYLGGAWHSMEDMRNPFHPSYHAGANLTRDTPFRVRVVVDPAVCIAGGNRVDSTLMHEITVHAAHAAPWLRRLRSGAYRGSRMRDAWGNSDLLHGGEEHDAFALGANRGYNMTAQNIYGVLGAAGGPFQADVRFDQRDHAPAFTVFNQPGGWGPHYAV